MLTHGVTRKVVRLARFNAGAAPKPRGRPRGATRPGANFTPALVLIGRCLSEQRSLLDRPAPSRQLLASRVRVLHEAYESRRPSAIKQALVELGAVCALALEHLQQSEAA